MSLSQLMYKQPGSGSRTFSKTPPTSKLHESSPGIAKKLFGRKSSISSDSLSSSSSSTRLTTPTEEDFAFTKNGPFFKAPSSPPSKSTHTTSPSRTSLTRRSSGHGITDCCFCDIPLRYILGAEDIVEFRCTHLAHFECLVRLAQVINRTRKRNSNYRLPACGVCDEPTCLSDSVLKAKFEDAMTAIFSSRSVPDELRVDSSTLQFIARMEKLGDKHKCSRPECKSTSASMHFFSQVGPQALPDRGPATIQCLIGVGVSGDKFYKNEYKNTPSDDVVFCHELSKLKRLSFKGIPLDCIDMSHLRLVNNFRVSSDLYAWSNCVLYLFPNHIILTTKTDGKVFIKAVVDLKNHLASAKVLDREKVPHLELQIRTHTKSRLYLICEEIEPLDALCAALYNGTLSFPILRSDDDSYALAVPTHTGEVLHRTPMNIVMCIEHPDTPRQADALVKSLASIRKKMSNFDQLAVVLHGQTIRSYKFQSKHWPGWQKLDETLGRLGPPMRTIDLNKSLEAAEELLRNLRVERSSAAVIIASGAEDATIDSISTGFIYSDTPIYTIGIGRHYDGVILNTLAAKTDGIFVACEPEALKHRISTLFDMTTSRTHKNVDVKLVPVSGVHITGIEGWKTPNFTEKLLQNPIESLGTDVVYSIKSDGEDGIKSVPLGTLHEKSVKSFIITLDIDDCALINAQDGKLLDAIVYSRPPLSISHHHCTNSSVVKAQSTPPKESIDIFRRQTHLRACTLASEIASCILANQNKMAYQLTQSERAIFKGKSTTLYSTTDTRMKRLTETHFGYIHNFFNEISDRLFQPNSSNLIGEILNFISIHSTEHFVHS